MACAGLHANKLRWRTNGTMASTAPSQVALQTFLLTTCIPGRLLTFTDIGRMRSSPCDFVTLLAGMKVSCRLGSSSGRRSRAGGSRQFSQDREAFSPQEPLQKKSAFLAGIRKSLVAVCMQHLARVQLMITQSKSPLRRRTSWELDAPIFAPVTARQ